MGCIHSTSSVRMKKLKEVGGSPIKAKPEVHPEILELAELATTRKHTFIEKSQKKRHVCDVCKENITDPGAFCKDCKLTIHKTCEAKVSPTCPSAQDLLGSIKSSSLKKRGSLPRRKSVEKVMEHVMEHHYDFDLTYITERIISVFFLPELEELQYRRNLQEVASMLKSKHQDKFLLLNLSEKRHDIIRLNPKVQDYGWPDLHAPPLDRICAICKAMETWLSADAQNVVVLHCKGNKGKTGVIVAAYMHYSKISAGADQALTTLAMRKFCEDKVSSSIMQPSQNRYVYYFGGLLSGTIKMNSSPLFIHQILIPSLPNFQAGGGFYPFLKIYQSLQLVYTSGVYDPQSSRARKLCVTIEPALLLKGDIMVKCFHRRSQAAEREVVFRVQFHTCAVHGAQLWFGKSELDQAYADDRFPPDATVEFVFSNGPEKMKGREYRKNDASIKVDYNISDLVVRWDSYENFNLHHQDSMENISHTRGPLDGSLYAQVKKHRGPGSTAKPTNGCLPNSPTVKPQAPSPPRPLPSIPSDHQEQPSMNRVEGDSSSKGNSKDEAAKEKTGGKERDRETAILDDGALSSPRGSRRERSCCGQTFPKCGSTGWDREPCLVTSHCHGRCNCVKNNPKSQTLPALPSKPVSPPPNSSHMELCHRHSSHPLPELPWERPAQPLSQNLPCLHRPCCPYPTPEHSHPHSHTLPPSNRLCTGPDYQLYHFPSLSPSTHLSHQSLPTSPYRELFFGPPTPSSGCPCRDCITRREHQSVSVRTFHPLHPDQEVNPQWPHGPGLQRTREVPQLWESESPWEVSREAEFWQCKPVQPLQPAYSCPTPDQRRFPCAPHQSYPSPKSLVDVRDGVSSGYHTPPQPHHSCSYSPYQSSPAESHESHGYVSGYHSGSASPLPGSTPSPSRARLPDTPSGSRDQQKAEKVSTEDDISQDSNAQSSTPGLDSDHDYTLIGSSSPTHTEDSVTPDSTPAQSQETTTHLEDKEPQTETLISTSISANSTQLSGELSRSSDCKGGPATEAAKNQTKSSSYAAVTITPVRVQLNGSALHSESPSDSSRVVSMNLSTSPTSTPSSPCSPLESPEPQSSPQRSSLSVDSTGQRLTPDSVDTKPPSPVPDGYNTPTFPLAPYYYPLLNVPHIPYTGYTAVTIPVQPPLPEKKRLSSTPGCLNGHGSLLRVSSAPSPTHHVTFSSSVGDVRRGSAQSTGKEEADIRVNAKFVQDSSKYWYKPGISRDQAIAVLKDKEPGSFLIRDSNSFQGAYGLALKVATPPPNANITGNKGDLLEQLVRHFLIETGPRGVKIKGCQNESYFGSLSALVFQHSITPISLPCALRIPEKDLVGELQEIQSATNTSTAADLLKQGAACNVLYLNSVETESLTGPEAVSKATKCTLSLNPRPVATVVHFKVSAQGITLTDSKRRLFFRRHYPINTVTFSSLDPKEKRMFGFVARRTGSASENVCHLFAEIDPEQPAVAIVNFINKVMLGPHLRR